MVTVHTFERLGLGSEEHTMGGEEWGCGAPQKTALASILEGKIDN